MELLPIIYNSLLIAAGLFVVTIAISYISYRIKNNKELVEEDETSGETHPSFFKDKKQVKVDLKPQYNSSQRKESAVHQKLEINEERKEIHKKYREPEVRKEHKKDEPKEQSRRIERVNVLSPSQTIHEENKKEEKRKTRTEDKKSKKGLKSIDDDPLKKYVDSSDDDFHPLKTDD